MGLFKKLGESAQKAAAKAAEQAKVAGEKTQARNRAARRQGVGGA